MTRQRSTPSGWIEQLQRDTAAELVLRFVSAGFWPNVAADEIARVAGVTRTDLEAALQRRKDLSSLRASRARGLGSRANRGAPPGQHWCSGLTGEPGHFVDVALMCRNSTAPSGYSNMCRAHHARRQLVRKQKRRDEARRAS